MKIYLAPMEGITTYVFRNAIAKYYGGIDRYYTPFLTASHLKGRELRDVHPDNNKGIDLVPQILVNDAELFLSIAQQLAAIGYKEVNLNLGCPSGTVVSKGRGSGFLDRVEELDRFLDQIYDGAENIKVDSGEDSSNHMQISIKTRIGFEFLSEWEDILKVYIKYPIKELIIHPRLRNEFYTGTVHLDAFKMAEDLFAGREGTVTPLCYNGDVVDIESYKTVISSLYGDDGSIRSVEDIPIMIGRGLVSNPNLSNELKSWASDADDNKGFDKKTFSQFINEIMECYIDEMSNENQVVMKMKELWTYFSKGLGLSNKQIKELYKTKRLSDYKNIVQMIMMDI